MCVEQNTNEAIQINHQRFRLFLLHHHHLPYPHCHQFWEQESIEYVRNLQFCIQQQVAHLGILIERRILTELQPEQKKIIFLCNKSEVFKINKNNFEKSSRVVSPT